MEPVVKQRLIGAIVLVALGVIFIPMLLDQETDPRLDVSMQIPERPVYEPLTQLDNIEPPVITIPPVDRQSLPEVSDAAKQKLRDLTGRDVPAESEPVVDPAPVVAENVQPAQPAVAETDSKEQAEATAAKPVTTPQPAAPQPAAPQPAQNNQFIVQLGSFTQQDNAQRMVDTLKQKDYQAFLESVTGEAGTVHRVRVGPFSDRTVAETVKARLEQREKRQSIVLSYP